MQIQSTRLILKINTKIYLDMYLYIMINCRLYRVERGRGVYKISFVGYQSYIIININN